VISESALHIFQSCAVVGYCLTICEVTKHSVRSCIMC
jgi:hypothetical protein